MRKLIAFDDETYQALTELSYNRMGTFQELADEAFRDLLKKHGVPVNLKDALKRSVADQRRTNKNPTSKRPAARSTAR